MLWDWYLGKVFGPIGYAIKPPLGLIPFAKHSASDRIGYAIRLTWWRIHDRLDRRFGVKRRAEWEHSFRRNMS